MFRLHEMPLRTAEQYKNALPFVLSEFYTSATLGVSLSVVEDLPIHRYTG